LPAFVIAAIAAVNSNGSGFVAGTDASSEAFRPSAGVATLFQSKALGDDKCAGAGDARFLFRLLQQEHAQLILRYYG
jgi:hypothetical protein